MARWDDGYVTDVVYTSNYYREITPSWLSHSTRRLKSSGPGCGPRAAALGLTMAFMGRA